MKDIHKGPSRSKYATALQLKGSAGHPLYFVAMYDLGDPSYNWTVTCVTNDLDLTHHTHGRLPPTAAAADCAWVGASPLLASQIRPCVEYLIPTDNFSARLAL